MERVEDTIEKLKPYDDILKPLYIGVLMRVKANTRAKTDYTQKGYLKKIYIKLLVASICIVQQLIYYPYFLKY